MCAESVAIFVKTSKNREAFVFNFNVDEFRSKRSLFSSSVFWSWKAVIFSSKLAKNVFVFIIANNDVNFKCHFVSLIGTIVLELTFLSCKNFQKFPKIHEKVPPQFFVLNLYFHYLQSWLSFFFVLIVKSIFFFSFFQINRFKSVKSSNIKS